MVSHDDTNILLDYGAMTTKEPGFPVHVQPKKVQGLVLNPGYQFSTIDEVKLG